MAPSSPKVFISHAGPDQARFVTGFAAGLRSNGVDAWYSKWEINAGDSLVDKIFVEGLQDAKAFIIVLSENSINRPWVKEELNAALVSRISGGCKIIPVILDGCEIPLALQSTVWAPIADTDNYEGAFRQILDSIFEFCNRPTLGSPPEYIQAPIATIPGLNRQDVLVLKALFENGAQRSGMFAEMSKTISTLEAMGIDSAMISESMSILADGGLTTEPGHRGVRSAIMVTDYGFDRYASAFMPDYEDLTRRIAGLIVNANLRSPEEMVANGIDLPEAIIERILNVFESRDLVSLRKVFSSFHSVITYRPQLKRWLDS